MGQDDGLFVATAQINWSLFMLEIPYVEPGQLLFRFMSHESIHFWTAITRILNERQIFLSSRTKFNDPYDSHPDIRDDLIASAIRRHTREMMQSPWRRERDPSDTLQILKLKAQGKTHLTSLQIRNIKGATILGATEFLDECGLASFSLSPRHPFGVTMLPGLPASALSFAAANL